MSLWLDEEFIQRLSPLLGRFHKQSSHTFAFRCPFCGDSHKSKSKTRGYLFRHGSRYFFKCHNCNESGSLRTFLKQVNESLYHEYQLQSIKDSRPDYVAPTVTVPKVVAPKAVDLVPVSELPPEHLASQYLASRQLPEAAWPHFYFTDEWMTWVKSLGWDYAYKEDHKPRLVIPWFFEGLLGAQFRALDGSHQRYTTLKSTEDAQKIYGWDRVNNSRRIYLVEGPFDSWFVPNGVAAMGSDLERVRQNFLQDEDVVFVWDNEPRNAMIVNSLDKAIKRNESVVIWPTNFDIKDLNDMHLAGIQVPKLVRERTFKGLTAQLEFSRWKKC